VAVSRRLVWSLVGLATLASVAYLMQEPETPKASRRTARASAAKGSEGFTQEDYDARFPQVPMKLRNPFVPLVASKRGKGGPLVGGIPPALAGGDPNWMYKGMAEIDSVPMALVENQKTGEGVFLRHGELWNGARVVAITPEALTLAGPDGLQRTVDVASEEQPTPPMVAAGATSELRPVTLDPSLRGPIGSGLGLQPEAPAPSQPGRGRRNRETRSDGMGGQGANSGAPIF